jgi:hypothetical protein
MLNDEQIEQFLKYRRGVYTSQAERFPTPHPPVWYEPGIDYVEAIIRDLLKQVAELKEQVANHEQR